MYLLMVNNEVLGLQYQTIIKKRYLNFFKKGGKVEALTKKVEKHLFYLGLIFCTNEDLELRFYFH